MGYLGHQNQPDKPENPAKGLSGWKKVYALHPPGSEIDVMWFDGWRTCKVRGPERGAIVVETKNGGIMEVDKLAALSGVGQGKPYG